MKPIFKYSGAKTAEVKRIKELAPVGFNKVVEPFGGSAALSFGFEMPAIIGDTREINIITLNQFKANSEAILEWADSCRQLGYEELKELYYQHRENLKSTDPLEQAKGWIFVRNHAFSGMDRVNPTTGEFNISYNHAKKFTFNGTNQQAELIQDWQFYHQDWKLTANMSDERSFVFFDPPYLDRHSTYGNNSYQDSEAMHIEIRDWSMNTKAKTMMVHIDSPFYRELYKDFTITAKDFTYKQNAKGRKMERAKVQHLYITNY